MSDVRKARVIARRPFEHSCRLTLELSDGRPLAFSGGQYVIIDTGLLLADGKKRKRAYSILSADREQQRFELGVRRLVGGLGSEWLTDLELEAEVHFSGPWGKLRAPSATCEGPTWVLATDTGITAALGLISGQSFAPHLAITRLSWWSEGPDYFLSAASLFEGAPECGELRLSSLPPIATAARLATITERVEHLLRRERPAQVYVIGDGHVCLHVRALLEAQGLLPEQIQVETFFHHPKKASSERAA